jgi:hypothetical protein
MASRPAPAAFMRVVRPDMCYLTGTNSHWRAQAMGAPTGGVLPLELISRRALVTHFHTAPGIVARNGSDATTGRIGIRESRNLPKLSEPEIRSK